MGHKALQKVLRHGNSAVFTIPRPILFALDLLYGDFVLITENGDGTATLRKGEITANSTRVSPGVLADRPEVPHR